MAKTKKKQSAPAIQMKIGKQPKPNKLPLLIAGGVVLAAIIVAGTMLLISDRNTRLREQDFEKSQEDVVSLVTSDIEGLLSANGNGTAKVYDLDGNQLFILHNAQDVRPVQDIPEDLKDTLWCALSGESSRSTSPRAINLDSYQNSKTLIGSVGKDEESIEDFVKGSFGWEAVTCYSNFSDTSISDESKLVIGAQLEKKFDADKLFTYIVSTASFGNTRGLSAASENWFSKTLGQLSKNQKDYLAYAFKNPEASLEGFNSTRTEDAVTAEELGFSDSGDPYWLLRRAVQEEFFSVLRDKEFNQEYQVRLRINPRIQQDVQSQIDTSFASSISLTSTGQTVLDGTVMVADMRTGYIVALVGGRSRNAISRPLQFNSTSNVGVYEAAREILEGDSTLTYASLLAYDTLSGQQEWGTLGGLASSGQLSLLGVAPVVEDKVTLEELTGFMAGMYIENGPRLIEQIQTSSGVPVYTAEAVKDVTSAGCNPDLRCLMAGTTDSYYVDYQQTADSGIAFASESSEFMVAGLYGASAQGYSLSNSDYSLCMNTALAVMSTVEKHFPIEPKTIDPNGTVAEKVKNSQQKNSEFVTELIGNWEKDLRAMPIDSTDSRQEFEYAFYYYSNMVSTYEGVVDNSTLESLAKKLEAVRVDRADELLKYSA